MADISAFRGIRYREDIALDAVVAPPYDVLSAAQAAELRARSPYNAVHVDLPVPPGAASDEEAYLRAAETFRTWRDEGVLVRDELPGIVVVDQTYTGPDGLERTRRGFVARLRIAALDERVVLPHERTHAGPKVDRLRLYRAAHADLSQIFLLFPDDDGSAGAVLEAAAAELPAAAWREAHDGDGNTHRCAAVAGPAAERVAEALRGRPVYIADGHHRYETALAYRDERRAAGDASADTLMVYLCSLSDPGLTVFPTHRLLHSIPQLSLERLRELIAPFFDEVGAPATGAEACRAALEALPEQADAERVFGLYLPREEACLTVRAREPQASAKLAGRRLLSRRRRPLGDPAARAALQRGARPGPRRRRAPRGLRQERAGRPGTARDRRLRARRVPQRHPRRPGAGDRRRGRGHAAEVDVLLPQAAHGARLRRARGLTDQGT